MNKLSTLSMLLLCVEAMQHAAADDRVTASDAMNASWTAGVCANATGELEARCAGVSGGTAAGPEAAAGNNTATSSSVGNAAFLSDKHQRDTVEERLEELKEMSGRGVLDTERFGFFVSGKTTQTERITTVFENGYDSDLASATIGMDYFFTDKFVAGFAVGYSGTDVTFSNNDGDTFLDAANTLFYANYAVNDDFSVDGYVGWSGIDYDITRNISYSLTCGCDSVNSVATAQTTADKATAGLAATYRFAYQSLSILPRLKFDYIGTFIDGYTEQGGDGLALKYKDQDIHSFKSELGIDLNYAVSTAWGVFVPYTYAGYVHEFSNDSRTIHTSFVEDASAYDIAFDTDNPDRDYMLISAGMSTVLPHGVQLFIDYERVELHKYIDSYTVSGGVRVGF
jgi:uncharacterized protein YhjY with autotransporter beta-barrel domain